MSVISSSSLEVNPGPWCPVCRAVQDLFAGFWSVWILLLVLYMAKSAFDAAGAYIWVIYSLSSSSAGFVHLLASHRRKKEIHLWTCQRCSGCFPLAVYFDRAEWPPLLPRTYSTWDSSSSRFEMCQQHCSVLQFLEHARNAVPVLRFVLLCVLMMHYFSASANDMIFKSK